MSTPIEKDQRLKDVNLYYGQNRKNIDIYEIDVIKSQLLNIFSTRPGDRWGEPTFGSYVYDYLFMPNTELTAWQLEGEIFSSIENWLNNKVIVNMAQSRVEPNPANPDQFVINLSLVVPSSGISFDFSSILSKGT
jgi:phage baseplate assembly protein W